jgi:hypothetical protein
MASRNPGSTDAIGRLKSRGRDAPPVRRCAGRGTRRRSEQPCPGRWTQLPLSENDEYESDEQALSPSAAELLRPRRWFVAPVIIFMVFGVLPLLVAIGFSRLGLIEQLWPLLQNEAPPPPKRPDRLSDQLVGPIEPFKSLVWDTAQSYLASGSLPVATMISAKSGKPERRSERIAKPSRGLSHPAMARS